MAFASVPLTLSSYSLSVCIPSSTPSIPDYYFCFANITLDATSHM